MQRPLLLAALALLALLVSAQGQVFYSDSIQFPTDFGQPSCMAHDPVSGVLYIVGSSSVRFRSLSLLLESLASHPLLSFMPIATTPQSITAFR